MSLLDSIKARLTPKKVTVHEKTGKTHEQTYYTNPNVKQPEVKQPKPEETEKPGLKQPDEKKIATPREPKPIEQQGKQQPKQQQPEQKPKQEQKQQPQQQQAQSPADAGAKKYGFTNFQDFSNAMNTACGMGSYRDFFNSDAGRFTLHVLQNRKEEIEKWKRGEKTEPGITQSLNRLWYMSQMFHDFDNKTLVSERMFPGLPKIEIDNPKVQELPKSIIDTVMDSKKRLIDKADTEGKKIYGDGHKIGDTTVIDGITYRLEGSLSAPRWHRITPKGGSSEKDQRGSDNEPGNGIKPTASEAEHENTVKRTIDSERRGRKETEEEVKERAKALGKPLGLKQEQKDKIAVSIVRQSIQAPPSVVNLVPEVANSNLLDHQKEFVEKAASAFKRGEKAFLCGDIMGLGKTYQALALIAQTKPRRCIYVVPKGKLIDQSIGTKKGGFKDGDLYRSGLLNNLDIKRADNTYDDFSGDGVFITTYASLMANPSLQQPGDLIIWDECHNLKGTGSIAQMGNELNKKSNAKGGKVLFMSATPYQKLEEARYLHPLGMFPEDTRDFNDFLRNYGVKVKRTGLGSKAKFTYSHYEDHEFLLLGLHEKMFKKGIFDHRELKLDGLRNEFPKVQLTKEQLGLYNTVLDALDRAGRRARKPSKIRTMKAQRQMVAMRMLESFMIPYAVQKAEDEIKSGRQVAVFAQSVSSLKLKQKLEDLGVDRNIINKIADLPSPLDAVYEGLRKKGYRVVRYYGKYKEDIEEYQNGNADAILSSYSMGGTGLSVHHNKVVSRPRTQINFSIPYSGTAFAQVSARSHRLDSRSETRQFFLLPDGVKEAKRFARICAAKLRSMGASIRGQELGDAGAAELLKFERGDLE